MAKDQKRNGQTIYDILGIDPSRRQKKEKQPMKATEVTPRVDEAYDDPSAPSGSIFDKYSTYPEKEQGYWRYFRILTIVGIVTCVATIVAAIWGDDIASFRFKKSTYESYERVSETVDLSENTRESSYTTGDIDDSEVEEVEEEPQSTQVYAEAGIHYFAGKINDKYRVHMELDFDDNSGRYYYDKSGAENCMTLTIMELQKMAYGYYIVMQEFSPDGRYCGEWRGTIQGETLSGVGEFLDKNMPFSLEACPYEDTDF